MATSAGKAPALSADDSACATFASATLAFGHTDTAGSSVVSSPLTLPLPITCIVTPCTMMAHAGAGMLTGVSCSQQTAVGSVAPQRSRYDASDELQTFAWSPIVECATCLSSMCLASPGARCCTGWYTCSRALLAARSRLCSHASAAGENQQDYAQPTPVQRLRRRLRAMHTSNWPRHCCRSESLDRNMLAAVLVEPLQFCRVQGCRPVDWLAYKSAE